MRSGSGKIGLVALACALGSACATSPPAMPPPRVAFAQPPAKALKRASDLALPTEAPIVHERYSGWTLLADGVSTIPLIHWMGRPEDVYLALPSLLLPPVIHVAHGESGSAVISLVMRGAMLGGVYLAGRTAENGCGDSAEECIPLVPLFLTVLAIVPVVTIDAAFLARTERPDERWRNLPLQPSISMGANGRTWLSLAGRF